MEELLNERAAARVTNTSLRTLQRLRQLGTGPEFVTLATRRGQRGRVAYAPSALAEWIKARTVRSTSEALAPPPHPRKPRKGRHERAAPPSP